MTIAAYVRLHNLSAAEFGRRCGVSRAVAARWLKGEVPRGPSILKVVAGTRGEVTANEILGIGVTALVPAPPTALVPVVDSEAIPVEDRQPLDALKAVAGVAAIGFVLGLLS